MKKESKNTRFKRYCKTLTLKDDPELIGEYKKVHAREAVWPEINTLTVTIYSQGKSTNEPSS